MTNFDDPRAIRLRAYELVQGETFLNEEGKIEAVPFDERLMMASLVEKFISSGEVLKGDAPTEGESGALTVWAADQLQQIREAAAMGCIHPMSGFRSVLASIR